MKYTKSENTYIGPCTVSAVACQQQSLSLGIRITKPLYNSNRNWQVGSWFSSIELAEYLLKNEITFVGTLKKTQGRYISRVFTYERVQRSCISLWVHESVVRIKSSIIIPLRFANVNARSLFTGFDQLTNIITEEDLYIVAVTETWLNSTISNDLSQTVIYTDAIVDLAEAV